MYYSNDWGFDVTFETQVGSEFSEFMRGFREKIDGFWVATISGEFTDSVAIDGSEARNNSARLRWFIMMPRFQGSVIGRLLLRKSIEFCKEAGYKRVYLWAFKGLEAGRYLYEREGFRLCKAHEVRQWGQDIIEQMYGIHTYAMKEYPYLLRI